MKQINNYISDKINESINNDFVKFITETDFTSITNGHPCSTKAERLALAKIQEQEVVENLNDKSLEEHYLFYEKQGLDKKEIIKKIAKDRNVNKNEIYQYFLKQNK